MEKPSGSEERRWGMAALGIALLPIIAFYALLFREMRNVPILDDYHAILGFAVELRQLPGLGARLLSIVTAQNVAYKYPLMNAFTALYWSLTGHVSFTFLMVIGNFLILGILWLLWANVFPGPRSFNRKMVLFLPICFLLLQLGYGEAFDWATSDWNYIPATMFSFAALHFLLRPQRSIAWACLSAFLGFMCYPNASLVWPIGAYILFGQKPRWARLVAWAASLLLCIAIYLFRYQKYPITAPGVHPSILFKAGFYLSLVGAAVENMSGFPVRHGAMALGLLILGVFAYSLYCRFDKTHKFAVCAAAWTLLTASVVTQWRSPFGMTLSLIARYKIYSVLLLIYCYVFASDRVAAMNVPPARKKLLYAAALTATVLFAASSDYFGWRFLTHRRIMVAQGLNQYAADPTHNVPMISMDGQPIPSSDAEDHRQILNQAIQAGIYTLPPESRR